jgi:TRAP-type C4-dicarboxylate transport system permease small subunit
MTGLVVVGVIARAGFNLSIPLTIEYVEYLIPVIGLWGAAYTLSKEGHVITDIVVRYLPDRPKQWFTVIGYLLGLAYLIILILFTSKLALTSIKLHYVSFYPTETPFGYWQLMVPIGLSLFALQLLVEIIKKARLLFSSYK